MKELRITTEEFLYYLFFGLLFFAKGIGLYDGQLIFKLFLVVAIFSVMGKIAIGNYQPHELLVIIGIIMLAIITYLFSGDKGFFLYSLMMIGMKHVDKKKLFKFALCIWGFAFVSLWLVSLTRMDNTMYRVANKIGMDHIFRWSMGYAHPNVLHISYLVFAALILLVIKEKITWKHYLVLIIGNLFVFLFSVSYTGVAIVFLMLIGRWYLQIRKELCKWEKIFVGLVFPGCVFLSLLGPVILRGKAFELVDKLLNTRLRLANYYLKPEYLSLFGKRLSEITNANMTMDNSYVFAFIAYGIIPFSVIFVSYLYLIYRYLKLGKMVELLVILVMAVAGLTEPFLFNTAFKNLTFIFMGELLFQDLSKGKKKEFCLWKRGNREFTFNVEKIWAKFQTLKQAIFIKKRFISIGALAGMIIAVIVSISLIKLPEGYVLPRKNCEDISEKIILYKENCSEYADFYLMDDFELGDEIQYFSGDIVRMEFIRNICMGVLLGGGLGAIITLFAVSWKRR